MMAREVDQDEPELGRVYTRAQFARLVGVSPWTLKRWSQDRYFVPRFPGGKGGRGHAALYTHDQIAELRKLPRRFEGSSAYFKHHTLYTAEDAQKCFGAFDEGKSPRYCVTQFGVHPDGVIAILERYALLDQGFLVTQAVVERINKLPHIAPEPIRTPQDLLGALMKASASLDELEDGAIEVKEAACATCKRTRAIVYCRGCVKEIVQTAKGAPAEAEAPSGDDADED